MDSGAGCQTGKREDQRMTVDHGVSEPAWWTEENGLGTCDYAQVQVWLLRLK